MHRLSLTSYVLANPYGDTLQISYGANVRERDQRGNNMANTSTREREGLEGAGSLKQEAVETCHLITRGSTRVTRTITADRRRSVEIRL